MHGLVNSTKLLDHIVGRCISQRFSHTIESFISEQGVVNVTVCENVHCAGGLTSFIDFDKKSTANTR